MAKKPRTANLSEVRVKLLAADLKEGAVEAIVRLPGARAEELIAARKARRVHRDDFSFDRPL
jgi:hypothetical protein